MPLTVNSTIGDRLATGVLAIGRPVATAPPSRHTARRRPNRCAAHPEPFSY